MWSHYSASGQLLERGKIGSLFEKQHGTATDYQTTAVEGGTAAAANPTLRILLVGPSAVGKTSLVRRYMLDDFMNKYEPTTEPEYFVKHGVFVGNVLFPFDVEMWDTKGGGGIGDIPSTGKVDAVMVIFDVSDKTTLGKAHDIWAADIAHRRKDERFRAFLVGSKCDTPEVVRGVSHQTGEYIRIYLTLQLQNELHSPIITDYKDN